MFEITEKVELMKIETVKVCINTITGRSPRHKNLCFCVNLQKKLSRKKKILTVHVDF